MQSAHTSVFQSTLSMRRATVELWPVDREPQISIHALHEESDWDEHSTVDLHVSISIHALHEESDAIPTQIDDTTMEISIHALHEESDEANVCNSNQGTNFNPRSP